MLFGLLRPCRGLTKFGVSWIRVSQGQGNDQQLFRNLTRLVCPLPVRHLAYLSRNVFRHIESNDLTTLPKGLFNDVENLQEL